MSAHYPSTPAWPQTASEAITLQTHLATQVEQQDRLPNIQVVAGVDVAYQKDNDLLVASAVLLNAQTLDIIEHVTIHDTASFPYIPGLFSFRELPPLIKALKGLSTPPDLVVCDAQGRAHPRRFGLACHLGVLLDLPSIGCGKTRLIGTEHTPAKARGSYTKLIDDDEIVGATLRTQDATKPVYVSIGHRISLATACNWVLRLCTRYRLPETTRAADQLVKASLKQHTADIDNSPGRADTL